MQQAPMRLNKFISESGLCSRREADRYIEQGHVFINGRRAVIGDQVKRGDRVRVNGIELEPREAEETIFIALNKPPGITSTTEEGVRDNIVRYVNHSKRIFPIGRLDKDSQGLILLTNDGDMVNLILRAGNNHEKEYVVTVNKPLTDAVIQGMSNGVPMLGVMTKKCKVMQEAANVLRITLIQGLNRQIRRMCEHFGYEVTRLERVRIMNIGLKGLPLGDWRELTEQEKNIMYALVADSSAEPAKKSSTPKITKAAKPAHRTTSKASPQENRGNQVQRHRGHSRSSGGKSSSGSGRRKNAGRRGGR